MPYGTPFFEEASAVIARKVKINEDFIKDVIKKFKNWDFSYPYNFDKMRRMITEIYHSYQRENSIFTEKEGKQEYEKRVEKEIKDSKDVIEKELGKKVEYLCWPHGDNDTFCHNLALQVGYKATTVGKSGALGTEPDRFERIGLGAYKNSKLLTLLKAHYKIQSFRKIQPYYGFHKLYYRFHYGMEV